MSQQKPHFKDPFWLYAGLATLLLATVLVVVNGNDFSGFKDPIVEREREAKMNIRVLP